MKTLLLVVDYQNDFVCGSLGFKGAEKLESPIAEKIYNYRKNGDDVAFTLDSHGEDYLNTNEGKNLPILHCLKNTNACELYGKIKRLRLECDKCFYKSTFGSDTLFDYLRKNPYNSVEIVGLVTNICVLANAVIVKTALPEAEIVVDSECTASNSQELYSSALSVMESMQIKIV